MRYAILAIGWIMGSICCYFFAWKQTRPKDKVYYGSDREFGVFYSIAFSWIAIILLWLDWLYDKYVDKYSDKPVKW
jgi:hypothetical protein